MGRQTVKIVGADVLEKKLRELPDVVARGGRAAVRAETHEVAQDMRRNAPRDTGRLVAGIQEEIAGKGGLTGRAVSTADYTTFVIHGTSKRPRNDFMSPAAERSRRRFPETLRQEVKRALKKVTG